MGNRGRSGSERRAARLATSLHATLDGRRRLDVDVLDLSLTGCLVRCAVGLDRGLILDLALATPQGTVSAKVRVAETSCDGEAGRAAQLSFLTGLEFLSLAPRDEQVLREFFGSERKSRRREP
jgi:c-di-GMP-binding flagellar brake protein YcgR